jgi:hypothetical protein
MRVETNAQKVFAYEGNEVKLAFREGKIGRG